MPSGHARSRSAEQSPLVTSFARNVAEVRSAQRLRYSVFAEEMGALVPGREQGIDCDLFDAYCDHLIVRDTATDEVVGTYRLLPWARARRAGGFCAQGEFDLSGIAKLLPHAVEAGRACVHPDYRRSAVLAHLWSGVIDYALRRGAQYLMGCVSVGVADGGTAANAVHQALSSLDMAAPEVTPLRPYVLRPHTDAQQGAAAGLAPLIRGYIRLGASLCAAPAWDPHFNCADFFLLLSMARLNARYLRLFGGHAPTAASPPTAAA